MQSAPYLEGDNYYMPENSKSSEGETDLHSSDNNKDIIDEESLREQLSKTEEEIITLRQVLNVKLKLAQDIKRQLGITVINEMKGDIIHGINTIKESNTFKATTNVMKNVKDKTSTTISTASSKFSQKIGLLRNTNTFKSIEGKMGTAYTSVKKVPCKYNPGDKIFAKVKGFVYWPARVNPLPVDITIPPNKIPIFFYGTHEVFFISPTSCWPYDEKNKAKWGKPKSRAHFNQGMDEIENKSTIYQYGVDSTAEDFLSQFYEFKRSNGQNTTPNKLSKQENSEVDEDENGKIKNKSIAKIANVSKKRNKSGSTLSTKENKSNSVKSNAMTELTVDDSKSPESINDLLDVSHNMTPPKKRQRSGSALSAKENNNCEMSAKVEPNIDNGVVTRRRQVSGNDDPLIAVTNSKSNKSRSVSRKRHRNDSNEDVKSKVNNDDEDDDDDKSKVNMDCDLSEEPIKDDKIIYDVNQTSILELMPASVVKLENNLDDKLISEMLKKDANDDKQSEKSNESDRSEQLDDDDDNKIPKTRYQNKSIGKKVSSKKESIIKSDTESDSLSVDSDNPDDEDFRPATKVKKLSKKIKSPKQHTKINIRKSVVSQPKRNIKAKTQTVSKKRVSSKVVSDDSLSSLSSVEEWNLPVEKKESEEKEKPKVIHLPTLQLNDSKEFVNSKTTETIVKNLEKSPKLLKEDSDVKIKDNQSEKEIAQDHKYGEVVLENEVENEIKNCKSDEIIEGKETETKVVAVPDDKGVDENNDLVNETSTKRNQKDKEKKSMIIIDSGDENENVSENLESREKSKKNKNNLKEIKVNKSKSKVKPQLSRKRNRKLSSSSDSDVEIVKKESKPKPKKQKLIDRNSESDDSNNDKGGCDKLQILQNFNADIRSSLVLGKEDYKTCLERFRSLCEMQIDLISLVKVWQLMDTVKKCRRYKRNEHIKQEAQLVYKRFMEIYTQASKDEIGTAQSLLAQYRHQNNVQHQHVGVDSSNKSNGLSIPISVADMFQNRLSDSHHSTNKSQHNSNNKDDSAVVNINVSTTNSSSLTTVTDTVTVVELSKPLPPPPPTKEEINLEKMRLLSIDLEAKVSDMLNKIERNVDVMNQKSLSHLLPTPDENFTIKLPTQWKSVNDKSDNYKDKYDNANNGNSDDDDDDDEDDVEAIVRRIEEVPIKLPEPETLSIMEKLNGHGSSSALDARIENLFNSSFITSVNSKDSRQKKSQKSSSSSRHHSKSMLSKTSASPPAQASVPAPVAHTQSAPAKLDYLEPVVAVIKNSDVPIETANLVTGNNIVVSQEEQKDDIEIYDLLGV